LRNVLTAQLCCGGEPQLPPVDCDLTTRSSNQGKRTQKNWLIFIRGSIFTKANNSFAPLCSTMLDYAPLCSTMLHGVESCLELAHLKTTGKNTLCLCDAAAGDTLCLYLRIAEPSPLGPESRGIPPCQSTFALLHVYYRPLSPVRVGGIITIIVTTSSQLVRPSINTFHLLLLVSILKRAHVLLCCVPSPGLRSTQPDPEPVNRRSSR
jgi:hypothetical protein